MKEHSIMFANFISNNFKLRGIKYKYAGDFYNNGPFLTIEQVYSKFELYIEENKKGGL